MRMVLGPFRFLYKLYFGIVFAVSMAVLTPIKCIFLIRKEWIPGIFYVRMFWSRFLAIASLNFIFSHREAKLPDGPYIIVSNHQSYFDIVFMYMHYSRPFVFIGKAELSSWPLFGFIFKRTDIPVDRDKPRASVRALEQAGEVLERGGRVCIFAEGTIPKDTPTLKRFKNGAFSLAISKQVPIVPMTILNHYKRFSDPGDLFGKAGPGICRSIIHKPIDTTGMTNEDLVTLRQQVFDLIDQTLSTHGHHR